MALRAVLDAIRLGPDDDETEVTAAQLREVIARLIAAGHWHQGDLPVLVVFDARYDVTRLAWLLADLPVDLLGLLRSDRVMWLPRRRAGPGRTAAPRKHGHELALSDPATCPDPQITTSTVTSRYGTAVTAAWDRVHPRLTHRAAWLDHDGDLPAIEGTLIRLQVDHPPGDRDPKPVWLWWSRTGALPADVDRCWQSFLRRFGLEGPGLDRAEDPRPGGCGPVDLAGHRRPYPAAPGPPAGRRPAPPLGTARLAGAADPGPRPPRVPEYSHEGRPVHRNPARPARAGRQGRRTATRHHAMTWGKRRKGSLRSRQGANAQVKRQGAPRARKGVSCRRSSLKRCCAEDEGFVALRSRPAGGGFKPPHAALAEDCRGERCGKGAT
jgi:hypothetical protein